MLVTTGATLLALSVFFMVLLFSASTAIYRRMTKTFAINSNLFLTAVPARIRTIHARVSLCRALALYFALWAIVPLLVWFIWVFNATLDKDYDYSNQMDAFVGFNVGFAAAVLFMLLGAAAALTTAACIRRFPDVKVVLPPGFSQSPMLTLKAYGNAASASRGALRLTATLEATKRLAAAGAVSPRATAKFLDLNMRLAELLACYVQAHQADIGADFSFRGDSRVPGFRQMRIKGPLGGDSGTWLRPAEVYALATDYFRSFEVMDEKVEADAGAVLLGKPTAMSGERR